MSGFFFPKFVIDNFVNNLASAIAADKDAMELYNEFIIFDGPKSFRAFISYPLCET